MFFNFFNKQQEPVEKEHIDTNDIVASVTYYMKEDSKSPMINIELSDYDDKSILGLCKILDILCEDACYSETINMIKLALTEDGQEDLLLQIFSHISTKGVNKLLKSQKENMKDEPCIKPSDMLQ
jgi:hypothetical protein